MDFVLYTGFAAARNTPPARSAHHPSNGAHYTAVLIQETDVALPPLPPSNTARYFVDYTSNTKQHTAMFRYLGEPGGGPPSGAFISAVGAFLTAVDDFLPVDFAIDGARYSNTGSDVSLPTTEPTFAGAPIASVVPGVAPAFMTFVGRSTAGRKARLTVLGISYNSVQGGAPTWDYRITPADTESLTGALAALTAVGLVGIDGNAVTWYGYANLGFNAYWQKEAR